MCGIVAYAGLDKAGPILIDTLKRLEYRGYDSAGIAVRCNGAIKVLKAAGRITDLEKTYREMGSPGDSIGIGHTRWATHGRPSDENAHPHTSGDVAIVHNGIIENYIELRERLAGMGYHFKSETDSEVLAHLINHHYRNNLAGAVKEALKDVEGSYAIAVLSARSPSIVCARKDSPLVIGLGQGSTTWPQTFLRCFRTPAASQGSKDGEMAVIDGTRVEIDGRPQDLPVLLSQSR